MNPSKDESLLWIAAVIALIITSTLTPATTIRSSFGKRGHCPCLAIHWSWYSSHLLWPCPLCCTERTCRSSPAIKIPYQYQALTNRHYMNYSPQFSFTAIDSHWVSILNFFLPSRSGPAKNKITFKNWTQCILVKQIAIIYNPKGYEITASLNL